MMKHPAIPALALLLSVGAPALAQDTCGEVCTRPFWRSAPDEITAAIINVDVNASNEYDQTPLYFAATRGTPENILTLLEAGADVNVRDSRGFTPLHIASYSRAENILTLLEAGANANARDASGATPLHAASIGGTPENVLILLRAGADINARDEDGRTPLHYAAILGLAGNILILLEAGADGTAEDEDGKTPYDIAQDIEDLRGTDAYWALNDARFR